MALDLFDFFLALLSPLEGSFVSYKLEERFAIISKFGDKTTKRYDALCKALYLFECLWFKHVGYCLNFLQVAADPPFRDHAAKELSRPHEE